MKSSGDPIIDCVNACREQPKSKEQLAEILNALGWSVPLSSVLDAATSTFINPFTQKPQGPYLKVGDDGLYSVR
jgi:hypothetical protein